MSSFANHQYSKEWNQRACYERDSRVLSSVKPEQASEGREVETLKFTFQTQMGKAQIEDATAFVTGYSNPSAAILAAVCSP
ncbi:hypothetical protein COLO4_20708 [Corchorus olitorius]|uniref:Uncharacterized protein n=1 Tax=Corchorus olitorius TaxID=93759 RepID=A0A1R3IXI4_9ROSI|nr:hypothetical protein COLO4_20708 [Corchorus olitorius]